MNILEFILIHIHSLIVVYILHVIYLTYSTMPAEMFICIHTLISYIYIYDHTCAHCVHTTRPQNDIVRSLLNHELF